MEIKMKYTKNNLTLGLWIALIIFPAVCLTGEIKAQGVEESAFISGEQAKITNTRNTSEITFLVTQAERYSDENGQLSVSVEFPKTLAKTKSDIKVYSWSSMTMDKARLKSAAVAAKRSDMKNVTMPPGPDDSTVWHTFSLDLKDSTAYTGGPLVVSIPFENRSAFNFTRVLIGKPSTSRSMVIGAFAPVSAALRKGKMISPSIDYLGTQNARQHFRIPANTLAPDTEAFDEMVDFGDAPFEPEKNNIDTVMLRTQPIYVGETTPVRLLRFANKSKKPISIKGRNGNLLYMITARLSPNARSGGFITVLPDGTYRSTTSLTPILEFQRVDEKGKAMGAPIVVDTAITPVAGFPFYLASDGGKWTTTAPTGRLTNSMTGTGFFYANSVNNFVHSNGVSPGTLGKCAKPSAEALQ